MSESASTPTTPASRRDLKSPYFVYRTPDGTGSYFTSENLPILTSPKEPLARFLVPAAITESGTLRSIVYKYDAVPLDTARQLEFLPQSEIDAFAEAVRAFYDKAHASALRVVPHEKRLRAHFRLPDPDLEPDAYWVYGPAHDRRLLILWGCEFKAGSSLPLAPDEELKLPAGRTILDRLRARLMSWELHQREAAKIAFNADEPISRFLARPAVDAAGQPAGVVLRGQAIAEKSLKPLKRILTGECAAFEKAANRFYDQAAPDAAGVTAYEKELRRAFRLPDPDKSPLAYRLHGKSLVIVVDGKETRDGTLPLTGHPAVAPDKSAPSAAQADGPVVVGPAAGATVASKLKLRAVSAARIYGLAAAAVLLLAAIGFVAWKLRPDHNPPKLVDFDKEHTVSTPDDTHVIVRFSKPIDPASIKTDAKTPSFLFANETAKVVGAAAADAKDPNVVVLTTSRLVDGDAYTLAVRDLADHSGNKLPLTTPPLEFKFFDAIAPGLNVFSEGEYKGKPMISAGENKNQLKLVFTKPLNPDSVARGGNYAVTAVDGTPIHINSGKIDPDDKDGQTVILDAAKEFADGLSYRLESISGVKDNARQPNFAILPDKGVLFDFKDVLPPRFKGGPAASAGRLEVTVTFTKPVDKASAEDVANYTATAPDKSTLAFVPGAAHLNDQGNILTLHLVPAKLGAGRYHLAASNIRDKNNNLIPRPLEDSFEFSDAGDHSPLTLTPVGKVVGNQLKVDFSRVLDPADANDRTKFHVADEQQRPIAGLTVTQAQRVTDNPTQVLLTFSKDPGAGTQFVISAVGVTDILGNKQDEPVKIAKPIIVAGVSAPTEQVLGWIGRPTLKGNVVTLTIKEEVAKATAQNLGNYEFTPATVQAARVSGFRIETDAKSGAHRTIVTLELQAPLLSPAGVKLAVHDLEAEGLEFLGAQNLDPAELVTAP
jgi:hypothetical protein